ncbi:MAG: hypothetical protein KGL39_44115 [Patescibacteria group bacterium]|nr:hypothetical protein [Patescibacteria group bacterium]
MTTHAYEVERAVRNPAGPQVCACGWVTRDLAAMKVHIAAPRLADELARGEIGCFGKPEPEAHMRLRRAA